ncbi:GapA-binding peptide SR1P [Rubeoparvulum massiliense]|nr:GapA-binding peptide SR1P [Rubeoparvulum massiliense]
MEALVCQHCGKVLQYLDSDKAGTAYGTCEHGKTGCHCKDEDAECEDE